MLLTPADAFRSTNPYGQGVAVTIYGVVAVTFMMTMYALEHRHRRYILGFAVGCLLSSVYGFLSGAWPFGVVECVWSIIAVRRYGSTREPALPLDGPRITPV